MVQDRIGWNDPGTSPWVARKGSWLGPEPQPSPWAGGAALPLTFRGASGSLVSAAGTEKLQKPQISRFRAAGLCIAPRKRAGCLHSALPDAKLLLSSCHWQGYSHTAPTKCSRNRVWACPVMPPDGMFCRTSWSLLIFPWPCSSPCCCGLNSPNLVPLPVLCEAVKSLSPVPQ